MSELSPADCAVAVRSFARRLAEHLTTRSQDSEQADERDRHGSPDAEALAQRMLALLQKADHDLHGSLAGGPTPTPLSSTPLAEAVAVVAARLAERIEQVPTTDWGDAALKSLRISVAEGGRLLRQFD